MKERTLSCVVDVSGFFFVLFIYGFINNFLLKQFGKPISRAMFLNSSSGRLEFRVHVGTLIKPENCVSSVGWLFAIAFW